MGRVTKEALREMIDRHVGEIREHVDSVRIFVTLGADDGTGATRSYDSGGGNYFAQQGQVEEWLEIQKQFQRNWAIAKDASRDEEV